MSVTDKALKVVADRPAALSSLPQGKPALPAVFAADAPQQADGSAQSGRQAAFLAELLLHGQAATPLAVGLFGAAGTGKSSLLDATFGAAGRLAAAAEAAGIATPFLARTVPVRIAVEPGRDPFLQLLAGLRAGLAAAGHPALAAQADAAFEADPHAAAAEASERLSAARHRLDDERGKLDDLAARQARLLDSVLFEGAGSRVDAYARTNRGRIDRALRRFGFGGDTALAYKEMVRDAAEPGFGRGLGWISAFWAFRGQMRLIAVAVVFFVLAWLIGWLTADESTLLDALRASNDKMGSTADWLGAHAGWLVPVKQVLVLAGLAALAMNVVRALRFIQPIARGATLLRGDLDGRRHDLDGLVAHQAKRVETVAREVEAASARAAEAERRAAARPATASPAFADEGPAAACRTVFATVSDAVVEAGREKGGAGPARIMVGLDGFERVGARAAATFLEAAHLCLGRPGFVTILAADRMHLATGLAETDPALARATLDRIVQVPVAVGTGDEPWAGARPLVQGLLRAEATGTAPLEAVPDAGRSSFDKPWLAKEQAVLEALAPYAGNTPRSVKRYVNLYRVARADPELDGANAADLAGLALGLALGLGGSLPPASLLTGGAPLNGDLQAARHAAATALGVALDLGRDGRGLDVARRYVAV